MRGTGHLLVANAKMFFRVRQELFWVFFLPIFLLLLLGPVMRDMAGIGSLKAEDVNFPVGVVDKDKTETSHTFINSLSTAHEFTVTELTEAEAFDQTRNTTQRIIVIFPPGFEETLKRSEASLEVLTDVRALPLTEMTLNILKEHIEAITNAETGARSPVTFVRTRVRTIDEFFDFIDFLIPGIMAMAIMTSCIFSLSPTIVRLREQGVMRRLWVTPLSRASFVASHVLFRLFIAVTQTLLIAAIGFLMLKTSLKLPLASIIFFVILGNLNGTAISFAIAGFAKTPEVASTIANVVSIPMLLLCGVFLPIEIMPPKALPLIRLLPLTHLTEGLRRLMSGEWGFFDLWSNELALAGYLIGFFVVSLLIFRWDTSTSEA